MGWVDGLGYLGARTVSRVSGGRCTLVRYRFYAQPVAPAALAPQRASATRFERVSDQDPALSQLPRPAHVIAHRFASGAHCFIAVQRERLIGCIWLAEREYLEDEVRCRYIWTPAAIAVWDFDVWVAPEARSSRTFVRLWDCANAWMRQHGYAWSLSRISAFNPQSRAAHARLGIVEIGSATFIVLGNLQVSFASRRRRPHIAWRGRTRPTFTLVPPASSAKVLHERSCPPA